MTDHTPTKDKTGGPAFPLAPQERSELRDKFAAKAMAAMIPKGDMDGLAICEAAYAYADEMLAERERE